MPFGVYSSVHWLFPLGADAQRTQDRRAWGAVAVEFRMLLLLAATRLRDATLNDFRKLKPDITHPSHQAKSHQKPNEATAI